MDQVSIRGTRWTRYAAVVLSAWFLKKGQEFLWSAIVAAYTAVLAGWVEDRDRLFAAVLCLTFLLSLPLMRILIYAYDRCGRDIFLIEKAKEPFADQDLRRLSPIVRAALFLWTACLYDGAMMTLTIRARERAYRGLALADWLALSAFTLLYSAILAGQSVMVVWVAEKAGRMLWLAPILACAILAAWLALRMYRSARS